MTYKIGTKEKPMVLKTPPLTSEYTMHVDQKDGKDVLVCTVGKTVLLYNIEILDDLHQMLKKHSDWMELGSADEQKPAKEGTVEAWGRAESNPVNFGVVQKIILLAAGMALKKDFVDVWECIFHL